MQLYQEITIGLEANITDEDTMFDESIEDDFRENWKYLPGIIENILKEHLASTLKVTIVKKE